MYSLSFFFFNDPAPTEIYTLSLHDALPILILVGRAIEQGRHQRRAPPIREDHGLADRGAIGLGERGRIVVGQDRKSTRLNSSHVEISYAVFCLKKKKKKIKK